MNSLFEPHSLDIGEAFTLADRLEFDSLAPAQYIALAPNGSSDVMNTTSEQMDGSELYYVPPALVLFLSLLYGSVSVISIVGNMLVIIVVCRYKSMQTVTNFFIANLRCAINMYHSTCLSIPTCEFPLNWKSIRLSCTVTLLVKNLIFISYVHT